MPDHLHLLVEGEADNADLKQYISLFKQISGYKYAQDLTQRFSADEKPKLWQTSFYDHVLRKEEDLVDVAKYIFDNPVRKGLADHYSEYSYSGSFVLDSGLREALSF